MKKQILLLSCSAILITSSFFSVSADEADPFRMEANVSYELDLDGDGTAEEISYLTYTNEIMEGEMLNNSNAVLDLFLSGDPFWSVTDEDWTYHWNVFRLGSESGRSYILAASVSDNDWTNQVLILTREPGSSEMTVLADLTELTRSEESIIENKLGAWARAVNVLASSDTEFTVEWMLSTMGAGNISIGITYNITDDEITVKEGPYPLSNITEWTSWRDFEVQVSPEDTSTAFRVSPEEKVSLTELAIYNNHYYLKCKNAQGQEGWIYDPDEIISERPEGSDTYLMGYFRESIFAG